MRSIADVMIPMRDGVRIPVDIYLPDGDGPFPTVLIRTPYIKSAPDLQPPAPRPQAMMLNPEGRANTVMLRLMNALPPMNVLPLIDEGYAVVVGDSRGTGYAEGIYDYYNVDGGPLDGYDTIEWLAAQDWSDGNIGLWGISGSGVLALTAAVTAPPHLKAVVASAHAVDFYHDQWFPGGVYRFEDRVRWALVMQGPTAPLDPGHPKAEAYEDKRKVFAARYARFYERMRNGDSMLDLDWATASTQHEEFDEYWQKYDFTERLASITAPTLATGVFFDHFIGGTTRMFNGVNAAKRLVLLPGMLDITGEVGIAGVDDLMLRWFDRFLKGVDNAVDQEPPVRLHLTGSGAVVESTTWPPSESEPWLLHLAVGVGESHELSYDQSPLGSLDLVHDPDSPNPSPMDTADQRPFDPGALVFTSGPLAEGVVVAGEPLLTLHAAALAADIDLAVRLSDVQPSGESQLLGTGQLRVKADANPQAIALRLQPVAFDVAPGHCIRLAIAASDFPFLAIRSNPSTVTLQFGSGVATLELPRIQG